MRDQQIGFRLFRIQLDRFFQIGQREAAFVAECGGRIHAGKDLLDGLLRPLHERRGQQLFGEFGVGLVEAFLQRTFAEADHFAQIADRRGAQLHVGGFVEIGLPAAGADRTGHAGQQE